MKKNTTKRQRILKARREQKHITTFLKVEEIPVLKNVPRLKRKKDTSKDSYI